MPVVYRITLRSTGDSILAVEPTRSRVYGGSIGASRLYSFKNIAYFKTMEEALECKRVLCEIYGDADGGENPWELPHNNTANKKN